MFKYMKINASLFLCFFACAAQAQYLKIDNGVLLSSFSNKEKIPSLSSKAASYTLQLGVDYSEHNWFSMSSQISYMRIGGHETNALLTQPELQNITERKDYVQLNTTFRPYLKAASSKIFIGIGPTLSVLAGSRNFESTLYEGYRYNRLRFGGKAELGIIEDIKKFRFGLVGAYLLDFSPAAKSEFLSLYNNAFSVVITTGYRLKWKLWLIYLVSVSVATQVPWECVTAYAPASDIK